MKILVINGPNLNMLGIREPKIYGSRTYNDLVKMCEDYAKECGVEIEVFQSNHEGVIVEKIQESYEKIDGIVINPAAYSHTSVAILDALKAVSIPTVEVHISDPDTREEFRHKDFVRLYAYKAIVGHGFDGYKEAIEDLVRNYSK
ncbi:MAG: type II 3-dehydroquinate dehydratase [Lachnospiraceae bacterium]|nr:type II 3-dehydroquinate dehydratase [Lachnospiraceae bacterium]